MPTRARVFVSNLLRPASNFRRGLLNARKAAGRSGALLVDPDDRCRRCPRPPNSCTYGFWSLARGRRFFGIAILTRVIWDRHHGASVGKGTLHYNDAPE